MNSDDSEFTDSSQSAFSPFAVLMWIVGIAMWAVLAWGVYIKLPEYLQLFLDYETEITVMAQQAFEYSAMVFPICALLTAGIVIGTRSKAVHGLVLIGFPLLLIGLLGLSIIPNLMKMVDEVTR